MTALNTQSKGYCLLISANMVSAPYPVYPIGIAHLIGALRRQGHRADHFDMLASEGYPKLEEILSRNNYDAIGISIRNIDSVDSSSPTAMIEDIATVIEYVRERCRTTPIVLGGPGFSIMPKELMDYLKADYGIVGEGEVAFPQLLEKIASGEHIPERLISASLSDFPDCPPIFQKNIAEYYIDHGGMLNVQTKRGCGYGCSYCSYPTIEGKKLRFRPAEEVVEEIERLRRHGARYIFFTDGVFNDPSNHYLEVAEALIRSGNSTPWCAFFRPQKMGREELRLLKRSGMAAMELGTDASTDQTLAGLNKGFTFDEVLALNLTIAEENIPCAHFIIFGGPGETPATVHQGLENIALLGDCIVFAYIGLRILPDTRLYKQAVAEKIITAQTDIISPIFYYSPDIDREFIDTELRNSFAERRDRIYPMAELEHYVRLIHSLGHSGPLWERMLSRYLKQ
ncbi:lipid biosynthesis B12-binding/radical SAM protein [Desulfopila inferna]|uniref:lipid biosynthesis B12-binding/radical SAM protein n=1 Tax=Desulfopila inferna TaxID=468528 RepID=UPI001964399C|nr:lipid biosynthesis B12-binding/radical SAM protein [Desulfopila inferna]MBM9604270.1 cobalamin-dependent protein [Desulfopila inferna]